MRPAVHARAAQGKLAGSQDGEPMPDAPHADLGEVLAAEQRERSPVNVVDSKVVRILAWAAAKGGCKGPWVCGSRRDSPSPRPMECSQLQTSPLLQESSRAAAEPPRAPPASAEEPSGPGRPSGTGEADPDDRKREIKEPTALAPAPAEAFGGGNGAAREMLADGATLVPASDRSEKPPCMLGVRLLRGEEHCWSADGGGASGGGGGESQRLERLDSGAPRWCRRAATPPPLESLESLDLLLPPPAARRGQGGRRPQG
uniref:Uncharacterized protein n=2 Tax=Emiliania huxleyi TaxID=2903 RepID=A0A7S3RR23_EMIHU